MENQFTKRTQGLHVSKIPGILGFICAVTVLAKLEFTKCYLFQSKEKSYLNPMKENWSQNQANTNIRIMLGKANPNQEAKFKMSSLSGNNLVIIITKKMHPMRRPARSFQLLTRERSEGAYWFIWPFRTRFGPVPVRVAVPPMLAA